jgi:hypothetical protein
MEIPSRRALYRIVYPLSERPTFEVGTTLYDVIDCSERGLRYQLNYQRVPEVGGIVMGWLHFRRGESIRVHGKVLRAMRGVVALALEPALPFAEVMSEQRYLRSKGFLLRD